MQNQTLRQAEAAALVPRGNDHTSAPVSLAEHERH
jgi:hypothetical protein